jgi:hypothetical protein
MPDRKRNVWPSRRPSAELELLERKQKYREALDLLQEMAARLRTRLPEA